MLDPEICIFICNKAPLLTANASGGDISNYHKLEALAQCSKVIVVSSSRSILADNTVLHENIEIVNPDDAGRVSLGGWFDRFFIIPFIIIKLIINRPVKQIFFTRTSIIFVPLVKLWKKKSIKVSVITRAYEEMFFLRFFFVFPRQSLARKIESLLLTPFFFLGYRMAHEVITNSHYMKNLISRYFWLCSERVSVEYPFIDLGFATPDFKGIRKIGFVNTGKHKGSDLVSELAEKLPRFDFLVYGNALDERKNVQSQGYVKNREKIYSNVDLLIVPSIWPEPYGRVATEAIVRGIPCLVSCSGGLAEAVCNAEFVVMSELPSRWVEKIEVLARTDPMVVNARVEMAQQRLLMRCES